MEKTQKALDDLLSSGIKLIPSWLSMLTSTRFLTFIATVAATFIEYQMTGGFDTWASLGLGALTAITGVSYIGFKTVRGAPAAAPAATVAAPAATAAAPAARAAAPAPKPTPFDQAVLDEYVESNVLSMYGSASLAAKYYTAMRWINYHVKFNNGAAYLEAIDCIEANYALPAFKEIWTMTYDEAAAATQVAIIENKPCTIKGLDSLAAYLGGGRREILQSLRDLRSLRADVDYRLNTAQDTGSQAG